MVRTPRSSRRGTVIEATFGPTMISQSATICADAGLCFRKVWRVIAGTSAAQTTRAVDEALRSQPYHCGVSSSAIASAPIASAIDLLRWYDRHRRRLPWRAEPGEAPDPYRVWLSEIMLQQTTVTAVIPYYERFVSRFPTVQTLAAAPLDAVLSAWAGLGYYARARNLHACAQVVAASGGFPADLPRLQALPGIGAYTAAAIGAIAFGIPTVPVDGNVERVAARLFAIEQPSPPPNQRSVRPLFVSVTTRPPVPGRATSPRRCLTWGQAFAPPPRPAARFVPGSPRAPLGGWASRRRCRARSQKRTVPSATACISG